MEIIRKQIRRTNLWPYLLVLPALLVVIAVVFIPILNAISMSLQNYDLRRPKQIGYIGLQNYVAALCG